MEEKILKAGAVVLSGINKGKIALLYRARHNDWSFPKGHVDLDESATQTMIREIQEETGLTIKMLQTLPDMEYINSKNGRVSIKMFLVQSQDDSKLRAEFESDDIQWIPYNEVVDRLSYDNLRNYFNSILPIIRSIINS